MIFHKMFNFKLIDNNKLFVWYFLDCQSVPVLCHQIEDFHLWWYEAPAAMGPSWCGYNTQWVPSLMSCMLSPHSSHMINYLRLMSECTRPHTHLDCFLKLWWTICDRVAQNEEILENVTFLGDLVFILGQIVQSNLNSLAHKENRSTLGGTLFKNILILSHPYTWHVCPPQQQVEERGYKNYAVSVFSSGLQQ